MVKQAIEQGFLLQDTSLEYVKLNEILQKEYEAWQSNGEKKAKTMQKIIDTSWRKDEEISLNQKYKALLVDLIDPRVYEEAAKLRSSSVKIENLDFNQIIKGKKNEYISAALTDKKNFFNTTDLIAILKL